MKFHDFLERAIETTIFQSRWLLAPLYLGLTMVLVLLILKFYQRFFELLPGFFERSYTQIIVDTLTLIDIVLVANLVLMLVFIGYEGFVSKLDLIDGKKDLPPWMGTISYSDMKVKVLGSIVAISSIELLKVFIAIQDGKESTDFLLVQEMILVQITFAVSGVLFALMERLLPHHEASRVEAVEAAAVEAGLREQIRREIIAEAEAAAAEAALREQIRREIIAEANAATPPSDRPAAP